MLHYTISGFADEISPDTTEQFKALNRLSIEYFEPRGIDGKNISELNDEEAYALKKKMDKYGIKVSSVGSPIGKIGIEDDFEKHTELLVRVIKTAKILECRFIRIFSFFIQDGDYEKHRPEVMGRMKEMTALAEREGIILLHENEKGIYGDIPERCSDILETVNSDNLKAVFDPANFVQCGVVTYPHAFDIMKKHIAYMHIKDALNNGTVVPSGYGEGHVAEILAELDHMNYMGFLSLEPHLGTFEGLEKLELEDDMLKLEKSDAAKFELAYNALMKVLGGICNG